MTCNAIKSPATRVETCDSTWYVLRQVQTIVRTLTAKSSVGSTVVLPHCFRGHGSTVIVAKKILFPFLVIRNSKLFELYLSYCHRNRPIYFFCHGSTMKLPAYDLADYFIRYLWMSHRDRLVKSNLPQYHMTSAF